MNRDDFVGQWCLLQFKNGSVIEALVDSVDGESVWCREVLQVYNEIPGIRRAEALIEPTVLCIPIESLLLIRTAPRERSEKFCTQVNGAHLVQGANTIPHRPRLN